MSGMWVLSEILFLLNIDFCPRFMATYVDFVEGSLFSQLIDIRSQETLQIYLS